MAPPLPFAGLALAGMAVGFPLYVAWHPQHFGAARIASPLSGVALTLPGEGDGRFGALAPLVDRRPARPAEIDPIETGGTGGGNIADRTAPALPRIGGGESFEPSLRPYDVRATAGALALIDDGSGLHVIERGDRLPDGSVMLGTRGDRLSIATTDRPAQAREGRLSGHGGTDADRTE